MPLNRSHKCPDKKTAGKIKKTTASNKHNTTKKSKVKKIYQYMDEYKDLFTRRKTPVSVTFIERLSADLLNWAQNNDDALVLRDFFTERGIPYLSVRRWKGRNSTLYDAIQEAKLMIGSRRERGSLKKEFDNSTFFRTAINYSPDFVKTCEWQSDLKQKQDEKTAQAGISWTLEKFPDSKLVPKKKDEDE